MINSNKYEKYFKQYNDYSKQHNLGIKYLESGKIISKSKYYRLLYYPSVKNKKTFFIIPSIFNSPEILFLGRYKNFIENLQEFGEIYLIDWYESRDPSYLLGNYVWQIVDIIRKLNISNINLIGHCIGGNLAIAVNILAPEIIKTLTLLTTSWDFSHLFHMKKLYQYLKFDDHINNMTQIPRIYIQILFFLLAPNCFNIKLEKFFSLNDQNAQDLAFRIENWLHSGHNLPKTLYNEIMNNVLDDNMFVNLQWQIKDIIINPSLIGNDIYLIAAKKDQIAPTKSILPLHKLCKNSKLIEVDGGHISYLINNKLSNLFEEYKK